MATTTAAAKTFTGWKQISNQPLRVYRDSSDETGTVMCRDHRDSHFTLYPSAHGAGEYGGECEPCRNA